MKNLFQTVVISLLLTLLTACSTVREIPKLVYIYPVVMAPSVDDIPEIPERNTYTVKEYPNDVLIPKDELNALGLYIIEMQKISASLREKLLYYIDITNWNKDEQDE